MRKSVRHRHRGPPEVLDHHRRRWGEQGDHAFERREDSTLLVRRIEHDQVEPIVLGCAPRPGSGVTSWPRTSAASARPVRSQVLADGRRAPPVPSPRRSRCAAPRDSASIPTAPLPAYRSSTRASITRSPRMPKSVSFTRSVIGRVPRSRGAVSWMPRAVPAITRMGPAGSSSRRVALLLQGRELVAHADQLGTGGQRRVGGDQPIGQRRAPARPGPGAAARRGRPPAAAAAPTAACRAGSPRRAGAGPPRRWRTRRTSRGSPPAGARDSSSAASETRMQKDRCGPRPTRPRSWCSCARPKRSASSMSITLAFGTSIPTSITVVATSTSSSPAAKACMVASRSSARCWPCTSPIRSCGSASCRRIELGLGAGHRQRLALRRRAGTTTKLWRPSAASAAMNASIFGSAASVAQLGADRLPARAAGGAGSRSTGRRRRSAPGCAGWAWRSAPARAAPAPRPSPAGRPAAPRRSDAARRRRPGPAWRTRPPR